MCESSLGRKTYFFSGNVAPGVAEVSLSGCGPDLAKLPTKSAQDCSESSICTSKSQKTGGIRALLEDEVGKNVYETVARAPFTKKRTKLKARIVPSVSAARTLVDLLRRSCSVVGLQPAVTKRNHWHNCAQESIGDVATLLLCGLLMEVARDAF